MDGHGIDALGLLLQNFLEVHFLDAGFCEGLPEEEKEPHPVYFGKDPFTGLYRPSEHLLACKTLSQDYIDLQSIYWPVFDMLYWKKEASQRNTRTSISPI